MLAFDHDVGSDERFDDIVVGWNKRDNCSVYYLQRKDVNTKIFSSLIAETRPDLIYVNSLFSHKFVVSALKSARDFGLPVLLAPRGQLCANTFKKKTKKLIYLALYRKLFAKTNVFINILLMRSRVRFRNTCRSNQSDCLDCQIFQTLKSCHLKRRKKLEENLI